MKLFLSNIPYNRLIRWAIFALGIFGVILPSLVDMFPYASWTNVLYLDELDAGLTNLSHFDSNLRFNDTGEERPGSILFRYEKGYTAIYDLLRTINPELPSLQNMTTHSSSPDDGAIFVYDSWEWNNKGGSIPMFRPVQISLKGRGITPICELKDLPPLIREQKVRFWSRVGSAFALLAIVIPFITETKISTSPKKPTNSINLPKSEANQYNVDITKNYKNMNQPISLLQIASVIFIVLGIALLVKSRK